MKKQITAQAATSVVFKVVHTLFGFAVAIVLARTLGADGYGIYSTAFVIASVCAILVQFGVPRLVVRETAAAKVDEDWGLMRALWIWATRGSLLFSLIIVSIMAIIGMVLRENYTESQLSSFFLALALVPLIALGSLRSGALRGLQHVILAQVPELLVKPILLLLLVIVISIAFPAKPEYAISMQIVASGVAFGFGALFLWRKTPTGLRMATIPKAPVRSWLIASAAMALSTGMNQINNYADVLILGSFSTAQEVGLYRVAYQVSTLVIFGLQAFTMVVAPHFVRLYRQNDMEGLQRTVTLGARIATLFALPVVIICLLFGGHLLALIFGEQYREAYTPLAILVTTQFVNAFFGAIGILLNMARLENNVAKTMAVAATCNLVLNFLLIPLYGMNGAAMATFASFTLWNTWLWRIAWKRLGIDSRAFALPTLVKTKS